jgi:hypothetical protein
MVGMTFNLEQSQPTSGDFDTSSSIVPESSIDPLVGRIATATQLRFDSLTATEMMDHGRALATLRSQTSLVGDETIGELPNEDVISEVIVPPLYYIQAAQVNHRAFLTTNLANPNAPQVTVVSSTWLLGRSRNCAVVVQDRSVSRCHAVVGYDMQQGFYIMDVGSSNGTCLNATRLAVLKRYPLKDGDVIAMCNLNVEFFIANDP